MKLVLSSLFCPTLGWPTLWGPSHIMDLALAEAEALEALKSLQSQAPRLNDLLC